MKPTSAPCSTPNGSRRPSEWAPITRPRTRPVAVAPKRIPASSRTSTHVFSPKKTTDGVPALFDPEEAELRFTLGCLHHPGRMAGNSQVRRCYGRRAVRGGSGVRRVAVPAGTLGRDDAVARAPDGQRKRVPGEQADDGREG